LEEEKSKHAGLAQQNSFGPAFLQSFVEASRVNLAHRQTTVGH